MDVKRELDKVAEGLKQQRDEIKVQLHLASLEAKQEWDEAEEKFEQFLARIKSAGDETVTASGDIAESIKALGGELQDAYRRIVSKLDR